MCLANFFLYLRSTLNITSFRMSALNHSCLTFPQIPNQHFLCTFMMVGFLNSDIIFFLLRRLSHKTVYFAHHCMFRVCSIYTQYNLLNGYEIHMNMLVIERMYIIYILFIYVIYLFNTVYRC